MSPKVLSRNIHNKSNKDTIKKYLTDKKQKYIYIDVKLL